MRRWRQSTIWVLLILACVLHSSASLHGQAAGNKEANRRGGFRVAAGPGLNLPRAVVFQLRFARIIFEPAVAEDNWIDEEDVATNDQTLHRVGKVRSAVGVGEDVVLGIGVDLERAAIARDLLDKRLLREIEAIDAICKLSTAQRKGLALAGSGDIKRFIDRAIDLVERLEMTRSITDEDEFREWLAPLGNEYDRLHRLLDGDFFASGSLLFKTARTILAPEQLTQLAAAEPRLGHVSKLPRAPLPGAEAGVK